jgi:hypothetical protein
MILISVFVTWCATVTKTNRNFIFLGREAHIPDRLYIMVMYIIFFVFKKNQFLAQNLKMLAFGFMEKL